VKHLSVCRDDGVSAVHRRVVGLDEVPDTVQSDESETVDVNLCNKRVKHHMEEVRWWMCMCVCVCVCVCV
jgi:hypothetical protein